VTAVNGEIWLRGEVGSVSASRAAERTAQNTRGSRRVHNFLAVSPMDLDDEEIVRRIVNAIASSDAELRERVMISADSGRTRIVGDVASVEQYRHIDDIVANTPGVLSVTNEMTVRGQQPRIAMNPFMDASRVLLPGYRSGESTPSDRSLYSAVQSELFWSPFVDEDEIEVDVDDGVVTLSGAVDSMSESIAAADNAFEGGALVVTNNLEVE
jgi:osmotically-inducible protein OsmY